MRSTLFAGLAFISVFAPLTARAQYDERSQKWLRNCESNWNRDRSSFCELRSMTLRPESRISVDGRENGGVAFHGWDRNEVRVVAMIQVNADDDNQAAALAKQIRITTSGGRISAEGPQMRSRSWWSVSYDIYVPTRSNLEAVTRNGGVSAESVEGDLDFQAENGGIRLEDVAGDVRGETTNGGVSASLSGSTWRGKGSRSQNDERRRIADNPARLQRASGDRHDQRWHARRFSHHRSGLDRQAHPDAARRGRAAGARGHDQRRGQNLREVASPLNVCGRLSLAHIFPGTPTVSGNADRRKAEQERRRILRQAER